MRDALHRERGASVVGLAAGVIVAAALVAIPLVLMARSQQERTEDALGALERAEGVAADASLEMAVRAASAYFAEHGSYAGLAARTASALEPGVRWNDADTAVPGEVSVRAASDRSVVLVTVDAGGHPACAALLGGAIVRGRRDAPSPEACLPAP
jgi:hypothetical protein